MPKTSNRKNKVTKSTLKYLAFAPDNKVSRAVLSTAPDTVVRAIANAALNAQQNPSVVLSPDTRNLFQHYSKSFDLLTNRNTPIGQKRKHLLQKGGAFPILAPILASVLGSIGSGFISKLVGGNELPQASSG